MVFIDFCNKDRDKIKEILNKGFLGEDKFKKVYHNYSFDHHAMRNSGLLVNGFHADTIHMARLYDTSLLSYSLEALTNSPRIMTYPKLKEGKKGMKELFAQPVTKKDGTEGID